MIGGRVAGNHGHHFIIRITLQTQVMGQPGHSSDGDYGKHVSPELARGRCQWLLSESGFSGWKDFQDEGTSGVGFVYADDFRLHYGYALD